LINVHRAKRFFLLLAFLRLIKENLFSSCNKSSLFFLSFGGLHQQRGKINHFLLYKTLFFLLLIRKIGQARAQEGGGNATIIIIFLRVFKEKV